MERNKYYINFINLCILNIVQEEIYYKIGKSHALMMLMQSIEFHNPVRAIEKQFIETVS